MNTKTSMLLAALLGAAAPVVYAEDSTVSSAVQEVRTKVYEMIGKDTVVLTFEAGRSALGESERKSLGAVVNAVRADATIASAIVAAWSDQEYPAAEGQSLDSAQRKVADARLKSVKDALADLGVTTVESHSMAEHPGWFARMFNTDDSRIKGEGKVDDANDQLAVEIGRILRDKGGPGKAVVIVRRVGDQTAH